MAPPASITYVTVQGTYVDASGQPLSGRVLFTPDVSRLIDALDNTVIIPTAVQVQLDTAGHFTASLMVSNDTDVTPSGWTYRVQEQLKSRVERFPEMSYHIALTSSQAPGPVYLSDIDPTSPILGSSNVYVRTVNGASGAVVISLASLGAGNAATRDVGTTSGTVAAGDAPVLAQAAATGTAAALALVFGA